MNSPAPLDTPDVLLLDLGGVLLGLDPARQAGALEGLFERSYADFLASAEGDLLYREFERGRVTPDRFRALLAEKLGGRFEKAGEFDAAFGLVIGEFLAENLRRVRALSGTRLFLLSNTNAIHVPQFERLFSETFGSTYGDFRTFFEFAHYSNELGERKPDASAFLRLAERHGFVPERTLFIDDNADNVRAAAALGFGTYLTTMNAELPDFR